MDGLQANTQAVHKDILAIRSDVKEEFGCFRHNLSSDTKRDLTILEKRLMES